MPDQPPLQLGWDMTEPRAALSSFLRSLPEAPQLLALGEPTHGVDLFPAWRNRIFRALAEGHGFRSIALESDIVAGQQVNAYVVAGQGNLEDVIRTGFSHGFGASLANRKLVEWMREFNAGRAESARLRFYGFDAPLEWWAPSPAASLLALHAFLNAHLAELPVNRATLEHLCGAQDRWANPAAVRDAAASIGNSDEARQLRLLADDLQILLHTEAPHLAAQSGFWEAQLHARTATGLLRYHAQMASHAPSRIERMAALRDLMMADNLAAIAEREQERGPTLVFAHNLHLQRHVSTMKLSGDLRLKFWSAGAHVSTRFGQRYAYMASDLRSVIARGIEKAAAGTVEGALLDPACPAVLFNAHELTAALATQPAARTEVPARAGYFPLDVNHLGLTDGVLVINDAGEPSGSTSTPQ